MGATAMSNAVTAHLQKEILLDKIGEYNGITDIEGITVGHYTDPAAASGVTVILCPTGAVAGVDVRGSAPGTRETDLLAPTNLVDQIQAVVLSGGSVFGLSAADGVVKWLSSRGYGYSLTGGAAAPIVPAATLFDLERGYSAIPSIGPDWGENACNAALGKQIAMGSVGAGTGALSGGIKGGIGTASLTLTSNVTVAALAAVNSFGSTIDAETGRFWEQRAERENEFGPQGKRNVRLPAASVYGTGGHTTIAVVATDALLTKAQAQKIAQMAHDGMARAIRPAHTMFDGDTVFCLATGKHAVDNRSDTPGSLEAMMINYIGNAAADCLARSILHGILSAETIGDMIAYRDLSDR